MDISETEFSDEEGSIFIEGEFVGKGLFSLKNRVGTIEAEHAILRKSFESRSGITFRPDGAQMLDFHLFLKDVPPNLGTVSNVVLKDVEF